MSSVNPELPRPSVAPMLLRLVMMTAAGAGVFYVLLTYGERMRWSDQIAIVVGFMCMASAVRILLQSLDRKALARRMQVEGESTPKEVAGARLQALLILALGVVVVWPPLAVQMGWPAPVWTYAVVAAFLVIRIAYTIYAFRRTDEFTRQRVRHVAWWTYFVGQTALVAYACAERLGLAPSVTAWDILVLVVGLSIVMSAFMGQTKPMA